MCWVRKELDLQWQLNWNARIRSHDASSSFFLAIGKGGTFCTQIEGGMMFQEQVSYKFFGLGTFRFLFLETLVRFFFFPDKSPRVTAANRIGG